MDGWQYYGGTNQQIMFRRYEGGRRPMYELRCHDHATNHHFELEVWDDHITFPSIGNCQSSTAQLMARALTIAVSFMDALVAERTPPPSEQETEST